MSDGLDGDDPHSTAALERHKPTAAGLALLLVLSGSAAALVMALLAAGKNWFLAWVGG